MAKQYGFYLNLDRCVECHACEVACKSANNVELGVKWRKVTNVWTGKFPNVTSTSVSLACQHCGAPACMEVCPVGAITKRAEDGIVLVDQEKCIGCRMCAQACPFGAPQFGESGKMQKCNLCVDRLAEGKQPACVATCPADALQFGTMDELTEMVTTRAAQTLAGTTEPSIVIFKLR